jgi:ribonuclease P protein component
LVQSQGRWRGARLIGIKARPNEFNLARWGIIASKRVGKAVVRNRVRRRLRELIRVLPLKGGYDFVVTARPEAASAEFAVLRKTLLQLLAEAGLLE